MSLSDEKILRIRELEVRQAEGYRLTVDEINELQELYLERWLACSSFKRGIRRKKYRKDRVGNPDLADRWRHDPFNVARQQARKTA